MRSHYKPEDFRREKRRVSEDWFNAFLLVVASVVAAIGLSWLMLRVALFFDTMPPAEPPIPAVSYETKRLLLDERRNVLLERIAKALETKPVATTNALLKPDPKRGQEILASAGITDLGGIKLGGDK